MILVQECCDAYDQRFIDEVYGITDLKKRLRYALARPSRGLPTPVRPKKHDLVPPKESLTTPHAEDPTAKKRSPDSPSGRQQPPTAPPKVHDKDYIIADVPTYLEHVKANNPSDTNILAPVQALTQWWETNYQPSEILGFYAEPDIQEILQRVYPKSVE